MIRVVLVLGLLLALAWAFWRLMDGVIDTFGGLPKRPKRPDQPPVKLVRDPVCGTWVDPSAALTARADGSVYFFCSDRCRSQFGRSA